MSIPRTRRGLFATPASLLLIAGCAESISDPIVRQGFSALDEAYVLDVKPADAKFTNCAYGMVDSRHVVRCGISYGSTQLAQVGYWEIEPNNVRFTVYAMNGKALSALERITRPGTHSTTNFPGAFKSGAGRSPLNISKVNEVLK